MGEDSQTARTSLVDKITESRGELPPIKRRYRVRHDRPRATMEASTEDMHHFIAFLWGEAEEVPGHVPRLSLDIWLDILLALRNIVADDPEKHRYTSIRSRIRNPYPDNIFSWMLNQLVELGFLTRQKDSKPYIHGRGVRYFLTEKSLTLLAMFDSVVRQRAIEAKEARF